MDKDDPWYNHTRMKHQQDEEILERLKRIEDILIKLGDFYPTILVK